MALILSSEKSHFIQKTIETYQKNRVGQYSKYLDTTPIFVTYYAINQAQSRAYAGSGQVHELLGPTSPIRYNKILDVPIYKMQQLTPNGNFEDGSYDVEMELSDITILPNTLRPRGDDFILITMPNCPKMLFRVTNFKMNTVQSNDFYMLDADIFATGDDCNAIESQVVETYHTVFENIGTQNNCFITADTYDKASALLALLNTLTEMYHGMYYYPEYNVYAYVDDIYSDTTYNNPAPEWNPNGYVYDDQPINTAPPPKSKDITYYDIYLIKFIMDSGIFFNADDNSTTSIVTFDDFEPLRFDYMFRQTLWHTIITKDTTLLSRYPYYFNHSVEKIVSVVKNNFNNPFGNTVYINKGPCDMLEYFHHYLLDMLINGKPEPNKKKKTNAEIDIVNIAKLLNDGEEGVLTDHIDINPYDYQPEEPEEPGPDIDPDLLYIFEIIYNYVKGIDQVIDGPRVVRYFNTPSLWSYRYHLIIIYILKAMYSAYMAG